MQFILTLTILFVLFLFLTNKKLKETFRSFNLIRSYTNIENAVQGVIIDNNFFYPINKQTISKYNIKTGKNELSKSFSNHPRINTLHSGISVSDKLFVCNQKINGRNTIEVFNKNLEQEYFINVSGDTGKLVWIDYYKKYWWGCFAHSDKNIQNTIVVEFYTSAEAIGADSLITRETREFDKESKDPLNSSKTRELDVEKPPPHWHIRNRWYLPYKAKKSLFPYSCSGGSFGRDGLLYLTGQFQNKLYVMGFHETSPMMTLNHIKETSLYGGGIDWNRRFQILAGINSETSTVHLYSPIENFNFSDLPDFPLSIQPTSPPEFPEIPDFNSYFKEDKEPEFIIPDEESNQSNQSNAFIENSNNSKPIIQSITNVNQCPNATKKC